MTAAELAKELQRLTGNGTRPLTVDLTGATLLLSAGVAALHHAVARSRDHDSELCLYAPPGSAAQHVLTLVALPYAAWTHISTCELLGRPRLGVAWVTTVEAVGLDDRRTGWSGR